MQGLFYVHKKVWAATRGDNRLITSFNKGVYIRIYLDKAVRGFFKSVIIENNSQSHIRLV